MQPQNVPSKPVSDSVMPDLPARAIVLLGVLADSTLSWTVEKLDLIPGVVTAYGNTQSSNRSAVPEARGSGLGWGGSQSSSGLDGWGGTTSAVTERMRPSQMANSGTSTTLQTDIPNLHIEVRRTEVVPRDSISATPVSSIVATFTRPDDISGRVELRDTEYPELRELFSSAEARAVGSTRGI